MTLAVLEDHEDLQKTVRRWLDAYCPSKVVRSASELEPGELPSVWHELSSQGWLGLHVPEDNGGEGFGFMEAAVVLEELGYSMFPGPVLSTMVVSAALMIAGSEQQQKTFLPGLCDGSTPAGVYFGSAVFETRSGKGAKGGEGAKSGEGTKTLSGALRPVLGGASGSLILAPLDEGGYTLIKVRVDPSCVVKPIVALDSTRDLGELILQDYEIDQECQLGELDRQTLLDIALLFAGAEAAGVSRWCLDTASEYAKVRVQFGRPIGQFQAVKHQLADMLVKVEQSAASAWDAALAFDARTAGETQPGEAELAASVGAAISIESGAYCSKHCIQILGGIGFTWEHDAHFYLKRAMSTRQLLGDVDIHSDRICGLALDGARRSLSADLPPEAETFRKDIRPLVEKAREMTGEDQRSYLVDTGLAMPHWPRPWGRSAGPLEQLVIDEELSSAGIVRAHLGVGAWALPTIISHGTQDQQERWVRPSLLGKIAWCQLFSEPGAGSDLASLSTRAEKVDGGWRLNGQKVWTSLAQMADWGICLARTDPKAPKHDGITYFIVDMSAQGLDIRPLRELTGEAMFNEVFFNDVFVPDSDMIGQPGEGWKIGRTTLANERVSLSSGAAFGVGVESVLRKLARLGDEAPPGARVRLGALLAEAHTLRLLGYRATLRSLSGIDVGAGASVRKLLGAEHEQRMQEMGLQLQGGQGATLEGGAQRWGQGFLATRCLTIAGGTSEVQRNVIAERILGQPRDLEPGD